MIIRKMTARFGRLDNDSLELQPGLNIIVAPNERGKSSWCAFIRSMLYGVDTAQRQKAGAVTEKSAANPWSGLSPQGTMEIEYEGRRLSLRRSTINPNAPLRQFSALYTPSGDIAPLTGDSCGQQLLGIEREVFARSAFIAQDGARIMNSPELERRISAIVSTGDEDISLSDAEARLRAWQRERHYNAKVGMNARLREKLAELQSRREAIARAEDEADRLRKDIERLERERPAPSNARLDTARAKEQLCRRELEDHPLDKTALENDRRECARLLEKSREKYSLKKLIAPAALLILSLILACTGTVEKTVALIPAGMFLLLCLLSGVNAAVIAKRAGAAAAKRRRLLIKWFIADEAGFDRLEREHQRRCESWEKARDELDALNRLYGTSMDMAAPLRQRLANLEGQLSVYGSARELDRECERIKHCMEENLRQKQDIDLALELLRRASEEQLGSFSPRLKERTRELFVKLTHGRYEALELDRQLNISPRLAGDSIVHGSESLSTGARQLLYLCLRLAICQLALPEEKHCPLILDDALCTLDDDRCADFLELLLEESKNRQIILFTCHSREAKLLRGRGHIQEVK